MNEGKILAKGGAPENTVGGQPCCMPGLDVVETKRLSQSCRIPMCVLSVSVAPYPQRAQVCLLLSLFYD